MNHPYLLAVATALMMAPFAYAHNPGHPLATPDGTPKLYCEPIQEWSVHDYGAPEFLSRNGDGNVEDCDNSGGLGAPVVQSGHPCPTGYSPVYEAPGVVICAILILADYDGHAEFATGGAWLYVCDAACGPSGTGPGAIECFGDAAHHGTHVTVWDQLLGPAAFTVAADHLVRTFPSDPCGDFESDISQACVGSCGIPFGTGPDGSYQVYVQGTQGHVIA